MNNSFKVGDEVIVKHTKHNRIEYKESTIIEVLKYTLRVDNIGGFPKNSLIVKVHGNYLQLLKPTKQLRARIAVDKDRKRLTTHINNCDLSGVDGVQLGKAWGILKPVYSDGVQHV